LFLELSCYPAVQQSVMFLLQRRPVYNYQISVQQISVTAGEQHGLDRIVGQCNCAVKYGN